MSEIIKGAKALIMKEITGYTPSPWVINNDDMPWTEGDSEIALMYGEEIGDARVFFSITDADGDLIALMPWEMMAAKKRQDTLRANAELIVNAANGGLVLEIMRIVRDLQPDA